MVVTVQHVGRQRECRIRVEPFIVWNFGIVILNPASSFCAIRTTCSYFVTFLFPSTALMPLEYCLPLMDVADTVEDLDFLESYRAYVKERTGVELIIES